MNGWSRLARRKQMEEQPDKELRFPLDLHAGDLMAPGCDHKEARRQARLALGGDPPRLVAARPTSFSG